jgi:hypothetical protein
VHAEEVSGQTRAAVDQCVRPCTRLFLKRNVLDNPVNMSLTSSSEAARLIDGRPSRITCMFPSSIGREGKCAENGLTEVSLLGVYRRIFRLYAIAVHPRATSAYPPPTPGLNEGTALDDFQIYANLQGAQDQAAKRIVEACNAIEKVTSIRLSNDPACAMPSSAASGWRQVRWRSIAVSIPKQRRASSSVGRWAVMCYRDIRPSIGCNRSERHGYRQCRTTGWIRPRGSAKPPWLGSHA